MSAPVISIGSNSSGYLDIIIGPMYSGKTSYLLRELTIFSKMSAKVLYINHTIDDRSDKDFSTHNPLITDIGKIDTIKTSELYHVMEKCKEYSIIGIDEAQFFNGLKTFVLELVETYGKRVIVTGLNGNFKREVFGEVLELIPCCDRLTKLSSCCQQCANRKMIKEAHFSYRLSGSKEDTEIMVGGSSEYVPLCRDCFLTKKI